jgi:hypothetical protein
MKKYEFLRNTDIFIYKDYIMNTIILLVVIVLVFIVIMTLILNKVEKEKISLMGDFFEKVLPKLSLGNLWSRKKKDKDD